MRKRRLLPIIGGNARGAAKYKHYHEAPAYK
jgi:hypothetical protein